MLILRILGVLSVIGISAGLVSWIFTRDRRYLLISWRIAQATMAIALLIMALMAGERILLL
jgi:hypothetical protein